jgi:hypothetical protein
MTRFSSESLLGRPVARYLRKKGFSRVRTELPFYERRIDLYGDGGGHGPTVAVELKLVKWRRGLIQALIYQLCADFSFLAVPSKTADRVDVALLREHGIGLLAVKNDGSCEERLSAACSDVLRSDYKAACRELSTRRR